MKKIILSAVAILAFISIGICSANTYTYTVVNYSGQILNLGGISTSLSNLVVAYNAQTIVRGSSIYMTVTPWQCHNEEVMFDCAASGSFTLKWDDPTNYCTVSYSYSNGYKPTVSCQGQLSYDPVSGENGKYTITIRKTSS